MQFSEAKELAKKSLSMKGKKGMMENLILGVVAIVILIILEVQVVLPNLTLNSTQQAQIGTGGYALWGIIGLVLAAATIFRIGRVLGLWGKGGME